MPIDPSTPLRTITNDLRITCRACGRVMPILAVALRAGAGVVPTVGELARRLRCTGCGTRGQVTLEIEPQ